MLSIELIKHCNFRCFFCKAKDLPAAEFMDPDLFKRIITEAKELGIKTVDLTPSTGEPFLHPQIYELLKFACESIETVRLFSNATAINVSKLKSLNLHNLNLNISQYGRTLEEFNELTNAGEHLYKIFQQRTTELIEHRIKHVVCVRTKEYDFNFEDTAEQFPTHSASIKCKYHNLPKIFVNGDVTFCKFAKDNIPHSQKILFVNLNTVSLKEALTLPIRYKFFDSQSICTQLCNSSNTNCGAATFNSFKLMAESKKRYLVSPEEVDTLYKEIENECLQPRKP